MELRHLECFVAVAEEGGFTRLHVVQSAVSATVKSLEHELGAPLFQRTSKRVDLTDAGLVLLPKARATLDAARAASDAVHEVRGGLRGTLRVGTMTSIGLVDVPTLLGRYHREYPEVTLRLTVAPSGSRGLVDALDEGRIDLAFVSIPGQAPAGIQVRDLASASLDLVVPAEHEFGPLGGVPIGELADRSFSGQTADVGESLLQQDPLAAGHLLLDQRRRGLLRTEPDQVQSVLPGAAVTGHRDDVGQGDRVLTRIVVRRDARRREILGDGEGLRGGRDEGQRHRAEVLLQVAQQGVADPFVVQDPAGDQSAAHRPVRRDAQQQSDAGDLPALVDPHGYGLDVHDRHPCTCQFQFAGSQPAGRRFDHVRHWADLTVNTFCLARPLSRT